MGSGWGFGQASGAFNPNSPGANWEKGWAGALSGGSIGVGRAVHSPPDGYTVSFGHLGTHVANGAVYKLGYDLVADLDEQPLPEAVREQAEKELGRL